MKSQALYTNYLLLLLPEIWKESKFDVSSVMFGVAIYQNFTDTDGGQFVNINDMATSDMIRDNRPIFSYQDKLTFSVSNKTRFGNIMSLTLIFLMNYKFDVHIVLEDSKRILRTQNYLTLFDKVRPGLKSE